MNIKAVCIMVLLFSPALAYIAIAQQQFLIFFDYGSSTITPEGRKVIKNAAEYVKSRPSSKVAVIGHTDTAENAAVSLERARTVAAEMVRIGLPSDRIIDVKGLGDSNLLVPTAKNEPEAQNRRVEIIILEKGR